MSASTDSPTSIGPAELRELVRGVDPAALLVPPRVLRRVIKQDRAIAGVGLQVPLRKTYVIGKGALLAAADPRDLGVPAGQELPDEVVLLACPEDWLAGHSRDQALVRFWRLLFHARIDQALGRMFADGRLGDARARELVHRLGQAEFEEACFVLRQENFLLPPADLRVCFTELVAVYLELHYFARPLLARYFPAVDDPERVGAVLAEVLDADALFAATRLPGAPEPAFHRGPEEGDVEPRAGGPEPQGPPAPRRSRKLLVRADKVSPKGNLVRSALLRFRAAAVAPPEEAADLRKGALAEVDRLVNRLQAALELHDREAEEWRASLPALLAPAARGLWPPSARLLYDLQKACVDYERDIYAVDLVEWFVSWGSRPVKRLLPLQSDVLLVKHLRTAAKRLGRANVGDEERRRLAILLRSAIHHCEQRLRERIRPRLSDALGAVGLTPSNYPEEVARRKVVEELLDRVVERGFLTMGDLRDALSRNPLKLSDLKGPGTFLLGDPLIRVNRKLAAELDGIYHRGEIYLRWLQRLSSLFFGTAVGRWITLYLILPFGGAYAALVFSLEMAHIGRALLAPDHEPAVLSAAATAWWVAGLGVLLLLLIHVRRFRAAVWEGVKRAGRAARAVAIDLPARVLNLPVVKRFLGSRPVVLVRRHAVRPAVAAGVAAAVCHRAGAGPPLTTGAAGAAFAVTFALFASRLGRRAEEEATDWLARNWYWLRVDLLPGLFQIVMLFFKEVLDRVERVLYAVDEWLRFRAGDSRWSLAYKSVLGLVWFFVTYTIRLLINVFIEPSLNPIKHFPAVTVTAKLILPLVPVVATVLTPMIGAAAAGTAAGLFLLLVPGLGGFMVWECKENWKLYRANRPRVLRPVMIGSHGETMLRFMRPGFHSGTLPKLYAKMRKAERKGNGPALHRHHEALHHVHESVRHFVERELLALLEGSRCWGAARVHVGAMLTAGNRVRVEVCCPDIEEEDVWLSFEQHGGWLVAGVTRAGWLPRLSEPQRAAFAASLAGVYKLAGVALVREQVDACLARAASAKEEPAYRVASDALVVWPGGDFGREAIVRLRPVEETKRVGEVMAVSPECVLYASTPVAWEDWVAAWALDQGGQLPRLPVLSRVRLLAGGPIADPAAAGVSGPTHVGSA